MADVFISYKHDDGDFATVLKAKLQEESFSAWMDVDIQAGEKWSRTIDDAIESALALLVIMTPEARASEFVTYEWSFALGKGIKVIPLLLKMTDLHPKLSELQYLNFTNRGARPWEKLIQRLKEIDEGQNQSIDHSQNPDILMFLNDLDNVDSKYRVAAARKLGKNGNPSAVPSLVKCLRDIDPKVRSAAAIALGEIGDPSAVDHLQMALEANESGSSVRKDVVTALGKIGNDAAIDALIHVLGTSDIGFPASIALSKLGDRAVPGLLQVLDETWEWILRPATKALTAIGIPAVPGLIKVLCNGNSTAQEYAYDALREINTPEAQAAVSSWEDQHAPNESDNTGDIPF